MPQYVTTARSATSPAPHAPDRKSTRLNSSHLGISYAVFCLKKKKTSTAVAAAWNAVGRAFGDYVVPSKLVVGVIRGYPVRMLHVEPCRAHTDVHRRSTSLPS